VSNIFYISNTHVITGSVLKSYTAASRFPLIDIAGQKIPRIILGQHPYDGTTYTSGARDQAYRRRWTGPHSMVELMKPIVHRFGVTASREVPTDTALSHWHQDALQRTMDDLNREIALVLGTALPTRPRPDMSEYLYRLSYALAGDAFAAKWRVDPIIRYRFLERRKQRPADIDAFARHAVAAPLTVPPALREFEVDYAALDALLDRYRDFTIPLFASNAAFELLVLTQRFDELQRIVDAIRRRFGGFLLGTHYAGVIIPMVEDAGVRVDGYLTPVNAAGIYMFPTQTHAVDAIHHAGKPVIAIKPLGGGRIPPNQAFHYLFHDLHLPAAMVGVGSLAEADETLGAAATALSC
jgi:hypothetical protein